MARNELQIEPEIVCRRIEKFIRDKVDELHRDGVVVGLSGGIDSSVVAYLASRALGAGNVLCLLLPEKHSSTESQRDARLVVDRLGTKFREEDLTSKLSMFGFYRFVPSNFPHFLTKNVFKYYTRRSGGPPFSQGLPDSRSKLNNMIDAFYRIKHRMRMLMLYQYAEQRNLLVAGTANKTEFLIGFFVKYGCDDAADIMPIRNLYKTQVRQLAKYLNVPGEIVDKSPSPDLIPEITDEYVIGLPYEVLDLILYGLECGIPHEQIVDRFNCENLQVEYVEQLVEKAKHKRQTPYVPSL